MIQPRQTRLIAIILLIAVMAAIAAAYILISRGWQPASTVDVARLAETAAGTTVRFDGNVTSYDSATGVAIVQDDTAAIAVAIPAKAGIRFSQRIQLSGTLPKNYDPAVPAPLALERAEYTVLKDRVVLPTRKVAITEMYVGFDPARFEVSGIVTAVSEQNNQTAITITSKGLSVTATYAHGNSAELAKLLDAKVAVSGVRILTMAPSYQLSLSVADPSDIKVIEPPITHPPLVNSLPALLFDPVWASGHHARLRGRVLKVLTPNSLLLSDGNMSIPVESLQPLEATPGMALEVEGWPVIWEHAVVLQGAKITARNVDLPAPDTRAPLTSSEQLQRLSHSEMAQATPVKINAVVTGLATSIGLVFLQDNYGGLYVRAPNQPLPITLGQRVTVRGVTNRGAVSTIIANAIFEPGAQGEPPAPTKVTAEDLNSGAFDLMWVELEGQLRTVQSPYPGLTVFKLMTTLGVPIDVTAAEIPPKINLTALIDARVRVRGVLSSVMNMDDRIVGRRISSFPFKHFQVISAPPIDPFTLAATPIDNLLRDIRSFTSNRTHVSGTVTMQHGDTIYIQDSTGGLPVDAKNIFVKPKVGDVISAAGYASPGAYGPTLADAEIRKTSQGMSPAPVPIKSEDAMSGKFEHRLVEIEARVLGVISGPQEQHLVLNSGGYNFEAEVYQRAPLEFTEGTLIKLSGVCTVQATYNGITRQPTSFRILVRDASHIEVVHAAPWWNARNALFLLGATACVMLLVLLWVWLLRRRVRAQTHEIEEQHELLRQVIDIAPDCIFVKDTQRRLTLANRALGQAYQMPAAEMIGKTVQQISQTPADAILHNDDDQEVIATLSEKCIAEVEHVDASGKQLWVQITKRPILDADGKAVGVLGVVHDITQRKRDEAWLQQARVAAEAANLAKGEFLANMSHEIRTPLNGIIGMTELALDTQLDSEQREYLQTARVSADTLLTVVNDILDFSKVDAGKLDLDPRDFDLRHGIEGTLKTLALAAFGKGLELVCEVGSDVPRIMHGDMPRLRQVLVNLLSNAIKFTERGEVGLQVSLDRTDNAEGGPVLHFIVSDSGIGIPKDKQRAIFEPFAQADSSTTRKYGGTGLGLTICTRLVTIFGGKIWVESTEGQGSQFHFTAHFGNAHNPSTGAPSTDQKAALAGRRILIVDDNVHALRIASKITEQYGMAVVTATSESDALIALNAAIMRNSPFDFVLVDQTLSGIEGFHLIDTLRARPDVQSQFIAALTADKQREGLDHCKKLGVIAQVLKPIAESQLRAVLTEALSIKFAPSATATNPTHPGLNSATLISSNSVNVTGLVALIAEDNPVNQLLLKRLLEKRGHSVTLVGDGQAAIQAVQAHHYDVVFMDIQMPQMDGLEATAGIRAIEQRSNKHVPPRVPIVALTAHAMKGVKENCIAAGMDYYLTKPVVPQDLDDVLKQITGGAPLLKRAATQ